MADPFPDPYEDLEIEEIEYAVEQFFDEQLQQEEEEDEDEETESEEEDVDYIPLVVEPAPPPPPPRERGNVAEEREKRRRVEKGEEVCFFNGDDSQGSQWNRAEIDGLFCSICFEAWTNGGDHHVCCLPCGHMYGFSCITKWIRQRGSSGKCPQCNRKFTVKDVRKLFASRIVAVDEESQKRIQSLEVKCASLKKKDSDWCKKAADWQKRETEMHLKVDQLTERTIYLERLLGDWQSRSSGLVAASGACQGHSASGHNLGSQFRRQESSCNFVLQRELRLDGARLFDVNASRQFLLIVRRLPGIGGTYVLTKMSLIPPHETEDILLPSCTQAIRDVHISPSNDSLALFASLGKKLFVHSVESNNVILTYDLPVAAWSCSWDINSSHFVYAGLQNGMLLVFDMRQTGRPMESMRGLTCNPIHSVHSLLHNSTTPGVQTILSASSIGLCEWNFGGDEGRPFLVPETANQGVCISLACCPRSDDIVASYRPKVEMSNETVLSQPSLTPSPVIRQGVIGSHVLLKRVGSKCYQKRSSSLADVPDRRLPKSMVIDMNQNHLFASGDELTCGLILQELPSLTVAQRLKSQMHTILDVKYTHALGQGLLGSLSEDRLQLFNTKLS